MKSTLTLLFGLMLFSTLHAQVPSYVPTDGLVGWWPFNGNANDETGNGNDGVVNGATLTEDRFGNAAACYDFNGISDFVTLPSSANEEIINSYSVSFWIYNNDSLNQYNGHEVIGDRDVYSFNHRYRLNFGVAQAPFISNSTYIECMVNNQPYTILSTMPSVDNWEHYCIIYLGSSSTLIAFKNGILIDSIFNIPFEPSVRQINIGRSISPDFPDGTAYYNGLIDDIAIYNRALTEQEIQNLYTGTTPAACTALPANLQNGLVGYWPFCGNANDESGNGNDGVVNGATLTEDRFGNANAAYGFDGVDDFIEVPNLLNEVFPGGTTFQVWIKPTAVKDAFLIDKTPGFLPDQGMFLSAREDNKIWCATGSYNQGLGTAISVIEYALNNWIQVTGTWNLNGIVKLYVNGQLVGTEFAEYGFTNAGELRFGIGSYITANYGAFGGQLDDVAIWNRALSNEEVNQLYSGSTPISYSCQALPPGLQENLVGYWPFCGNANDESGNGNDGVVNGAILTEDRFGNAASAYSFDGVDDFIESPFEGVTGSAARSLSYWSRTSSTEPMSCVSWGGNGVGPLRGNRFHGGYNYVTNGVMVGGSDCAITYNGTSPVSNGEWHHYAFVMNENDLLQEVDVYQDGTLLLEEGHIYAGNTALVTEISTMLQFGRVDYVNAYDYLNGNLDDIGIWNRALTPEEVQELYTLDACTFTVYDTLTVENVINVYDTLTIENIVDIFDTTFINVEVYDTLTVENVINVYDTLTIENIVDIYDTTYINVEVYDTLTVENIINVYDTLTIENIVEVYDTLTVENVIDLFDTTTVVETVVVFDTLTVENVIDVFDTTTVVETVVVFDTLTVENVIDVYDTTYVTVTDTLIIDIPSGVGGTILNTLLLYPNPTSDQLTINYGNFAAMAGYSLSIFDNGGSAVHETNITQALETLDISQWSAGVYQVVVYNAGGVPVETRQIVIQ